MKYVSFLLLTITVILFGGGCAGQQNLTSIDSSYSYPQSPYEADVTANLQKYSDTTESILRDAIVRKIEDRYDCVKQSVVLKKKHKLHEKGEAFSYLRAEDYDCFGPIDIEWDMVSFRSAKDREQWTGGTKKRRIAKHWLDRYMGLLYRDFAKLGGSGVR